MCAFFYDIMKSRGDECGTRKNRNDGLDAERIF